MGEKEIPQRYGTLRSLSRYWRNHHHFYGRSSGFTLVELLVVVGIIGILVTATLLVLNPIAQFQKGNDVKRKSDLSQIQRALETYYHDLGKYPQSSSDYKIIYNGNTIQWGSSGSSNPFATYMNTISQDPTSNSRKYVYYSSSSSNNQSYFLYAALERNNDAQLCHKDASACSSLTTNGIPPSACGSNFTCNFGLSSSNVSP